MIPPRFRLERLLDKLERMSRSARGRRSSSVSPPGRAGGPRRSKPGRVGTAIPRPPVRPRPRSVSQRDPRRDRPWVLGFGDQVEVLEPERAAARGSGIGPSESPSFHPPANIRSRFASASRQHAARRSASTIPRAESAIRLRWMVDSRRAGLEWTRPAGAGRIAQLVRAHP